LSRYLAIDPDGPGLFVVAGSIVKGAVAVEQAAVGPDDLPVFSPATGGAIGTALKELLKSVGIKPAPALVSLSRDRVILKEVKYPPCAPEDEPMLVRNQVIRELTDTSDDVVMDYVPLPPAPDGQRRAQVVFVRKDIILGVQALCDAAGLKLAGITPRPFASTSALKALLPAGSPGDLYAVAAPGERGGEFTIARGSEIVLTRTLSPYTNDGNLAGELKRNLAVFAGQAGATSVETIYIPEGGRIGSTLAERLQDALPILVEPFDLLKGTPLGERVPPALHGRFTQTIGLLHLKANVDALPINFTVPRQPRSAPGKQRIKLLLLALAATVVFGGLGVYGWLDVVDADQRLQAQKSKAERLDGEITGYGLSMKRLAAVDEFASREVVWFDELYDLADRIPDVGRLSISEIEGKALAVVKSPPKPPITTTGVPGTVPVATNVVPPKPAISPVASIKVVMRTVDANAAQFVADAFKNDKFYVGANKQYLGETTGKGQQYVLNALILHRTPAEYLRRLSVRPPVKPVAVEAGTDDSLGGF